MAFDFGSLLQGIGDFGSRAVQGFGDSLQVQGGLPSTAQRRQTGIAEQLAIMKGDFSEDAKEVAARKAFGMINPKMQKDFDLAKKEFRADQTARKRAEQAREMSDITSAAKRAFDLDASQETIDAILSFLPAAKITGGEAKPTAAAAAVIAPEPAESKGIIEKTLDVGKDIGGFLIENVKENFRTIGKKGVPTPKETAAASVTGGRNFVDGLVSHLAGEASPGTKSFFKAASQISPEDTTRKSFEQIGFTDKSAQQQLQELEKLVPNIRDIAASDPEGMKTILRWLKTGKDDNGELFTRKDFIDFISGKK